MRGRRDGPGLDALTAAGVGTTLRAVRRTRRLIIAAVTLGACLAAAPAQATTSYDLVDLGPIDSSGAGSPVALNDRGEILFLYGAVRRIDGDHLVDVAPPITTGGSGRPQFAAIDSAGRRTSNPTSTSGPVRYDLDGTPHPLQSSAPTATVLGLGGASSPGGWLSGAVSGQPIVWSPDGTPTVLPLPAGATGAVAQDVNDSGVAIGYAQTPQGAVAVRWDATGAHVLPPATVRYNQPHDYGLAINGAGVGVGRARDYATRWAADGSAQDITVWPFDQGLGMRINDRGDMVETNLFASPAKTFLRAPDNSVVDVVSTYPSDGSLGAPSAIDLNNAGQFLFMALNSVDHTFHTLVLNPIRPAVEITSPAEGAEVGEGGANESFDLRAEIRTPKAKLAGACLVVNGDVVPPPADACHDLSGPSDDPMVVVTKDLLPLADSGTLKPGRNTLRVWAYDANGNASSASVTVQRTLPNLSIRHLEVAQVWSPTLADAPGPDPKDEGVRTIEPPADAVTLVAGKPTAVRVYVDDNVARPAVRLRTVTVRLSGTLDGAALEPVQVQGVAKTRGATLTERQAGAGSTVDTVLPAAWTQAPGTLRITAEVNPGQADPECDGCYPAGNLAATQVTLAASPSLRVLPLKVADDHDRLPDDDAATTVLDDSVPAMPIASSNVTIDPWRGQIIGSGSSCVSSLVAIKVFALGDQIVRPTTSSGRQLYVGVAPHTWTGKAVGQPCAGIAAMGVALVSVQLSPLTVAHEFGHLAGLTHASAPEPCQQAVGAQPLPYTGVGGVAYDLRRSTVPLASPQDLMTYCASTWTSPVTWNAELAWLRGGSPSAVRARAAATGGGAAASSGGVGAAAARTRIGAGPVMLLAGTIGAKGTTILSQARLTGAVPPVSAVAAPVATIRALDQRGKVVSEQPVAPWHAEVTTSAKGAADVPFAVALPSADRIASVSIMRGGRQLRRIRRSAHRPTARFTAAPATLARSTSTRLRWSVADRDRGDRLTSTLLVAVPGAKGKTPLLVASNARSFKLAGSRFGAAKQLRLTLIVSDGMNATTITRTIRRR